MLRKCTFWSEGTVKTFGKTLRFGLVIVTVVILMVWFRTSDLQTLVHGAKNATNTNSSSGQNNRALLGSLKNKHTDTSKGTNFTAVILLTYMRSGSSFTGEILQQNENVFYVFEPLRKLEHLVKTGRPVKWMNGTFSPVSTLNLTEVKRQTLTGWLTCDFSKVYTQSFDDWYFFSFGKKTNEYNKCINRKFSKYVNRAYWSSKRTNTYVRKFAYRQGVRERCLQDLQNSCLSSKFRIIKTIRTSMDQADASLTEIGDGRIIHLIRDPRETLISQTRYHGCPGGTSSVVACANAYCEKVLNDTKVKHNILLDKPMRVLTVFYEQIASEPRAMAELMYKFIGMKFSEKVSDYVTLLAEKGNGTDCNICQQSWQARTHNTSTNKELLLTKMYPYAILYIQEVCKDVLQQYGYQVFNLSKSLINTYHAEGSNLFRTSVWNASVVKV